MARPLPPTRATGARCAAVIALVLALLGAGPEAVSPQHSPRSSAPRDSASPTIVLILTDDQRWDTLWAMPIVRKELAGHGITFTNSFVVDPLCCPSRAAILTARYPHSTGVWRNSGPLGGFEGFRDVSTVATWLDARGYRTALFGKYLNRYEGTTYVPPGWDHWEAFDGGSPTRGVYYTKYRLNLNGIIQSFGPEPSEYATDLIAAHASAFIRHTRGPLFVYFAPSAPHGPARPAARDARAFAGIRPWRPPSYNEEEVGDKPTWARRLRSMGSRRQAAVDSLRRRQLATLQSVDRAVGAIVDALEATGRLHNSLIVFTSDNGISWGEHRWMDKVAPWEENIRVPLVMRFDRMIEGLREDPHLILNVDLPTTFAALAKARAPGTEGRSLLPLLEGGRTPWRREVVIESLRLLGVPSYCGLRSSRYALIVYESGESEFYDLVRDPFELENHAADPRFASLVTRMESRLRTACSPPSSRLMGPSDRLRSPEGANVARA